MQGYPIGSFLFWNVEAENSKQYVFYGFIRDYHQLNNPHCPRLDLPKDQAVTGILDGQQRLTALNIGLRGSHAEKLPRKWWNNPDAYPVKHLYLDLPALAGENELGLKYNFRFLTPQQAADQSADGHHWFSVGDVLELEGGPDIFRYVQGAGLESDQEAYHTLDRLHRVVHVDPAINYFEVEDQDLDRVLNIFIRVNSGGTVLSYSDLLLSIATAQWTDRDAREEIHTLIDDLNRTGQGFGFSKDLVLKAGLVLADLGDIRFKVTNFNQTNMKVLEQEWDRIAAALRAGARLLADFGFSERTLTADSVLIPIAYYLDRRGLGDAYLDGVAHRKDREVCRSWVIRSLLKSGIWGSALDTLLSNLRKAIGSAGDDRFPIEAIEAEMSRLGKTLRFEEDEIEDLVSTPYGNKKVFPILSLLYPGVDVRNEFHVDHVFPRVLFRKRQLREAGIPEELSEDFRDRVDGLPNLQLLEGPVNTQKAEMLPAEWSRRQYPDEGARGMYLAAHDMHDLPDDLRGFLDFYEARKQRMEARLRSVLGHSEVGARPGPPDT